jgi:hypothetical protein
LLSAAPSVASHCHRHRNHVVTMFLFSSRFGVVSAMCSPPLHGPHAQMVATQLTFSTPLTLQKRARVIAAVYAPLASPLRLVLGLQKRSYAGSSEMEEKEPGYGVCCDLNVAA